MKIPFEKIFEHAKMNEKYIHYLDDEEKNKEYHKSMEEQFEIMKGLAWEDFECLTVEELEQIPIGWIYDWNKVTGGLEDEKKILELYEKRNLTPLLPKQYLKKFDNEQLAKHIDVRKILPHNELKNYIKAFLIDNKRFVDDVDACMWELGGKNKLSNKSVAERIEYFDNTIGNESRTYILKYLTLKHLSKILLENANLYMCDFWQDRLNRFLQNEQTNSTETAKNKQNETISINCTETNGTKENNATPKQTICTRQTKQQKLNNIYKIIALDKISISTLQRLFLIPFPRAATIMDSLIEKEIVQKIDTKYNIVDKKRLEQVLTKLFVN